ncbi:DUF1758 domain-containing protein [Trichonephila clavipes]|nr:DUF1758 domain-containing protein [Trichonephila clavipes]
MMVISIFVREATISDTFSLEILGISDPVEMKNKRERENFAKLHFEETVRINTEGRYEVSLPWEENLFPIPSIKDIAMKRLESSTKNCIKRHCLQLMTCVQGMGVIRVFHPIGFLCPVLIIPKLMLQKMWKDSTPWNGEVEDNLKPEFLKWFEELISLKHLSVSRCFSPVLKSSLFLVLSCCLQRWELDYDRSVLSALQWDNVKKLYWTDSTTVLSWIQREELWSVFVNNRVQAIRELTYSTSWKHLTEHLNLQEGVLLTNSYAVDGGRDPNCSTN